MARRLENQQFGRLKVIEYTPARQYGQIVWKCWCECGNEVHVATNRLMSGNTKSCGCLHAELSAERIRKVAQKNPMTSEYRCWINMKSRCNNPNHGGYPRYGGRGIKVCDAWSTSYDAFIADMGRKPTSEHSIDRIDNDGNYEPSNCRWATHKEQQQNTRRNEHITINGVRKRLNDWLLDTGISRRAFKSRVASGLSPAEVLSGMKIRRGRKPTNLITINGVTKSVTVWIEDCGVPISSYYRRCASGWATEQALDLAEPPKLKGRPPLMITIDENTQPLTHWLKFYKMSHSKYYTRVAKGHSPAEALLLG